MYNISKLRKWDYTRGYLQLLNQLDEPNNNRTHVISYEKFRRQYNKLTSNIFVMRDKNKVIASGSIFIEKKFTHNLGSVGHIEDIVVDKNYRKEGLGKQILDKLINYAKGNGCYEVVSNCTEKNIRFYKKCRFIRKETKMVYKIKD
uniref:Acetyltransferase (GNAT) family protein n=1 Tax=Mimivirus LCMiAC02 TaxID=2506609 RepID=A0A481Z0T6_9VIRU|nr:MAG: acetyltransferase (GNAT) family protein [Mimivirus LCMiAC02]